MVHKILRNVKYDEYGDPILDGLTEKQKKYLELRGYYRYIPEKQFMKAFNSAWGEFAEQLDSFQLDEKLSHIMHEHEMSTMKKDLDAKVK